MKRGIFGSTVVHDIDEVEVFCSLVCTNKKVIEIKVEVDVQKGFLTKRNLTKDVVH